MINIREVQTRKELKAFIKFPDKLYKGNAYRVPPLHSSELDTLDKKKNIALSYCEAHYWLAYKDNKIVGRIAAFINTKSNALQNSKNVRFGWIDFIDDKKVSALLIETVENWAKEQGMTHVHGPFGFTDMDLEGMLVEGFDEISTQAVLYNYPYYPAHLEELGYTKEVDWIQFKINVPEKVPEKITRISKLIQEKYELKILRVKHTKELLPYAKKMFRTLNESFKDLHEFVPLDDEQIAFYTKQYFSLINPKFVCFVLDKDDDVVGFGVSLYSVSKAFIKAKGKLYPTGFLHILAALRKNDTVDLLLQGVKPKYLNKGIPALFYGELMQTYIDNGVTKAISSHALEANSSYLTIKEFDHKQHLRRRCYAKDLSI